MRKVLIALLLLTASLEAQNPVTVANGTGVNAVNIQDGGNSITIDGNVGVTSEVSIYGRQEDASGTITGDGLFGAFNPIFFGISTCYISLDDSGSSILIQVNGVESVSGAALGPFRVTDGTTGETFDEFGVGRLVYFPCQGLSSVFLAVAGYDAISTAFSIGGQANANVPFPSTISATISGSVPVTGSVTVSGGPVVVTDGLGSLNVIVDSGTLTAVTSVTNPVTVTDGAGSLNTIVDSGTLTAVTSITNPVTVTDGAGSLNVIVDSGTITTVSTVTAVTAITNALPAGNNNIGDVDIASAIPAGNNNIGDVDVTSIAAGNNNIGDVDVASVAFAGVAASTGNGGVGTGVQRVTIANDSTGVLATVSNVATIGTSVTPGTGATNLGKAEDGGHTSADVGVMALGVRKDDNATTTSADAEYAFQAVDAYSAQFVRKDHPNRVYCNISSTATTSAIVTGCSAPGAGLSIYITGISWSSSIISTTTNFMTIQSGTGGTCGSNTTAFYRAYALAFTTVTFVPDTPIKLTANHEVCLLHPGAGTRLVNISGFIAP